MHNTLELVAIMLKAKLIVRVRDGILTQYDKDCVEMFLMTTEIGCISIGGHNDGK